MIRIHREGYFFLSVLLIFLLGINVAGQFFSITGFYLNIILLVSVFIFLFFLQFFRNPKIKKITNNSKVISPANGKVVNIEEVYENEYFGEKRLLISIFMSPFDVHINRNPISGIVKYYQHHKGKYLVAWHPKSSILNERTTTVIENKKITLLVRQIAGMVARRIVNYTKVKDQVKQSEELGFIKFGSRADIYLPLNFNVVVKKGDKAVGGVTEIGRLN
jgi:phosphatidylserine decarboxylase